MINFNKLPLPQQDELMFTSTQQKDSAFDHGVTTAPTKDPPLFPQTYYNHDTDVIECLLNLSSLQELPNPLAVIRLLLTLIQKQLRK